DDLRRWRQGEPIRARPVGRAERAVKWMRRNPAVAALAAGVVLALAAGTAASTLFALEAEQRAREARGSAAFAEGKEAEARARVHPAGAAAPEGRGGGGDPPVRRAAAAPGPPRRAARPRRG